MKETVKKKLEQYRYTYSESNTYLKIPLGHAQYMIVDFSQKDKYIIKDRLTGWNFLTGMIEISLKNTMIYNTIGLVIAMVLLVVLDKLVNPFNLTLILIAAVSWIIIWTVYYLIKAESFKRQLIDWIDKES
ncbi:MAG: hypothetical protein K9I29_03250 [Bacteroidales bacterium]|nr:hypothetical protein [Bacteroidales bacterium]MCF8327287.1 hypothetical protein [Bacteroidales bacterium]